MKINLFDDSAWHSLRPLSFTRPVADLRIGILTIAEKWEKYLNATAGFNTMPHLSLKYPSISDAQLLINGSICPDHQLAEAVQNLIPGQKLVKNGLVFAYHNLTGAAFSKGDLSLLENVSYDNEFLRISLPEHIFTFNDAELRKDFALLTHNRISESLSNTNTILGQDLFAEEGAIAECTTFNTLKGPIYLGKNSQIWEGSNIRGSFALCHDSQVKMGAKIYGQTTIGPFSRVGGEINNAVVWGFSSKGHDGYLGNAVMGQWCNIGADSNNSNLKNNYGEVKLWDYDSNNFRGTGLQFCGLIMADHAKCGINTMFNTGTVVGVGASVFGAGMPSNYIPDFSWGGAQGFEEYKLPKMLETALRVYERRGMVLNQLEQEILTYVHQATKAYRATGNN